MLISLDFTTLVANTIERLSGSDGSPYEKRVDAKGHVISDKCIASEVPFEELPEGWCWARLGTICRKLTDGSHNPPTKQSSGYPVISATNITNRTIDLSVIIRYCDENGFRKENPRTQIKRGDIILGIIGGSIGNVGVYQSSRKVIAQRSVAIIDSTGCNGYLSWALESPLFNEYYKSAAGTAQGGIYLQALSSMLLPLPPLAEQRRIVERVNELTPLVEEYGGLEDAREALDAALPGRLRKSVLHLAVQGGLVPQDPADEPAGVLLERIRGQRRQLVAEKKMKAPKGGESIIFAASDGRRYEKRVDARGRESEPACIEDEIPFEIPEGWEWARLGSVFSMQAGKNIKASLLSDIQTENTPYPCFGGNGIRGFVAKANASGDYPIIGRQGALCGNVRRASGDFYATEHAVIVHCFINADIAWACLFLSALNLNQYATATAQPGLAVSKISEVLIPIPPLAEQHRIVDHFVMLEPLITNQ